MIMFWDGTCPECGGHTYGTPLHCDKCGWKESQESSDKFKKIMEQSIEEYERNKAL